MEKFIVHTGTAVPFRQNNVDTDQIIPSEYLKRITRTGFEDGLFAAWRSDENFVLNREVHAGASILFAGPNFGIGSSREHAVWALMDYGFKVVVSPSFADIFRGNAGNAGLLAVVVDQDSLETLWDIVERDPSTAVTVDLRSRTIAAADFRSGFQIDDHTRTRLLEGQDEIALTLAHSAQIEAFEAERPRWRPLIS
jgi:3-isopropylmalate/(R)-2-methylmalate dehydratase small subunit